MSKITTEDCKNFIKEQFGLTSTVNIKRERKYKDGNGDVMREFSIKGHDNCFIIENKNGELSIINQDNIVAKPVEKESSKEFNAKTFLRRNIKRLENDENGDVMEKFMEETKKLNQTDKIKVANEFYFYFPDMSYGNEAKFIVNGLDTPMIGNNGFRGSESTFCIWFYDSLDSEPDLYVSDILQEMLPDYFDKIDEYHFEIRTNDYTKKLSIKDMIDLLEHLGYKYKDKPEALEESCMLSKLKLK